MDAMNHAIHVGLLALQAGGPGNENKLIYGPQLLLSALHWCKALTEPRRPREQTNSPVGDVDILPCLVGVLVSGEPGVFDQVGIHRQFGFTQLPPHVAMRSAIWNLDLESCRCQLVWLANFDNMVRCRSRPLNGSLVVVGVEPAINQTLPWACADGFLISLVEHGEKVAVLLECVHRLLDPLAKVFIRTVEPKRLSRASMVGVNKVYV